MAHFFQGTSENQPSWLDGIDFSSAGNTKTEYDIHADRLKLLVEPLVRQVQELQQRASTSGRTVEQQKEYEERLSVAQAESARRAATIGSDNRTRRSRDDYNKAVEQSIVNQQLTNNVSQAMSVGRPNNETHAAAVQIMSEIPALVGDYIKSANVARDLGYFVPGIGEMLGVQGARLLSDAGFTRGAVIGAGLSMVPGLNKAKAPVRVPFQNSLSPSEAITSISSLIHDSKNPLFLAHSIKDSTLKKLIKSGHIELPAPSIGVVRNPMWTFDNNSLFSTPITFYFKPSYIDAFPHEGNVTDAFVPTYKNAETWAGKKLLPEEVTLAKREIFDHFGSTIDTQERVDFAKREFFRSKQFPFSFPRVNPNQTIQESYLEWLDLMGKTPLSLREVRDAGRIHLLNSGDYGEVLPFGNVDLRNAAYAFSERKRLSPTIKRFLDDNGIPFFSTDDGIRLDDYLHQTPGIAFQDGGNIVQHGRNALNEVAQNNANVNSVHYAVRGGKIENNKDIKDWKDLSAAEKMHWFRYFARKKVYDRNAIKDYYAKFVEYRKAKQQKPITTMRGQWDYPGHVTKIPSNNITMEGVSYPVLGVSDTGDTKMMYPNGEYRFNGNSVTEYPMNSLARGGHLFQGRGNSVLTTSTGNDGGFEAAKIELQRRIQEANERAGFSFQPLPDQHKTAVTFNKDYNEYMPLINLPEVVINGGKRNDKWNSYHDAHAANVAKAQQAVQEWDDRDQLVLNTMMGIGMAPLGAVNPTTFALGAAGGEAVNAGVRAFTDYEGFGDMMSNTIHGNSDYAGLYDWANPGYLIGGKGARLDNRLFGRTPTLGPHTTIRTNGFGEPVGAGFQIGKPPVTGGALTEAQLNAYEAVHQALGRKGMAPIINSNETHFAVKTSDGWALSRPEYAQVNSQLNKVNATAKAKTGKVNDVEIIRTSENEYLIKNNNDGSFDVLDANNIGYGDDTGIIDRGTAQAWLSSLQKQSEVYGRLWGDQGYGRGNSVRNVRHDQGRPSPTDGSMQGGSNSATASPSRANGQGTAASVQRKVQIIDEVESAIKDSKGNVLGFNVDGNIHLFPKGMNPETPIHEYSEIWGRALQQNNPEGWANVRNILKTDAKTEGIWKEVLGDEAYARVHGDEDALAIEVLGRFSGKRGVERMQELGRTSRGRELLQKVQEFLEKAWNLIATDLFKIKDFKNADNIADKALYDMVNGTNLGKVKSDVGFNRLSLNEINHELSTEPVKQSELPEQFREVRHYYPERDIFVPKDFKGSKYLKDDGFSTLPSLESEYVFDNYAKAMGRRRSYLWMNMPYFYDDHGFDAMRLRKSNSFLIGQQHHPDGIFHPTHFAPETLRDGYRLIEQASNAETPTLFTVTDDLSPMLYKFGFKRLGQIPQIFNGEVVTKDVMGNSRVNKAAILSEIEQQYLLEKIGRNQYDNLISLIKGYDFAHGGHLFQGKYGSVLQTGRGLVKVFHI